MLQQIGEQELLAAIRNGTYAAFEEMHRRHYTGLLALAIRKTGDEAEAYDLLQDMFAELWVKREGFHITNPLENYLKNRLWFKLSGYFRTKVFRAKHYQDFADFLQHQEESATRQDAETIKEIEAQYGIILEIIGRTVSEMPDKMREIFILNKDNHYTVAEIAEQLAISPKTVRNQLNNAMNRIRQATGEHSLSAIQLLALLWLTI
ncbi:RNA polymerase sigma-70 factor (ECF subfamily) [Mucilaginibacter gracilis]|uniref:RNA polymerase sigma-70 factor (ECF subfamily) n=1 Tax=Mucilaginibacter gracilis TaxID=423350 RepID=A0A495J097_9SPHI|nr:sigma-70 family RNA polymerase sigma factor [Mucilaginibacter gracilis]RKR82142.1 RNA polymerase sigma-70 factor (ECF subfamily) [Mucilaginibacter gracilis]